MEILFDSSLSKLLDFILVTGYWIYDGNYREQMTCKGTPPRNEIVEAHAYIWKGLDIKTPGLLTLTTRDYHGTRFLFDYFIGRISQLRSLDVFIENFDLLMQHELRFSLLSFFDSEDHPSEFYQALTENPAALYDFVHRLKVSDVIKFELYGIAVGSKLYSLSLKSLFLEIAKRLDDVYGSFTDILEESASKLRHRIFAADHFFLLDEPGFYKGYQQHQYEQSRIIFTIFNHSLIYYKRNARCIDVLLGINYDLHIEQTYTKGSIGRYSLLFKSLSEISRIRIMELLRQKEMYIGELSRALDIPLTTLTYHINMLHDAEIIDIRTEGKKTYCSFKPEVFDKASLVLSSIS